MAGHPGHRPRRLNPRLDMEKAPGATNTKGPMNSPATDNSLDHRDRSGPASPLPHGGKFVPHPTCNPAPDASPISAPPAEPPNADEAERAVLAACMHQASAIDTARPIVAAEDFARPGHRLIWQALLDLRERNAPTSDPIAVTHALQRTGQLRAAGGRDYLAGLGSAWHLSVAVDYYAHLIAENAWTRRLHALGLWLTQATSCGADPADIHTATMNRLAQAAPPQIQAQAPGQRLSVRERPAAA